MGLVSVSLPAKRVRDSVSLALGSTTEWAWEQWAGKNFESSRVYRVPPDIEAGYKEINPPVPGERVRRVFPYYGELIRTNWGGTTVSTRPHSRTGFFVPFSKVVSGLVRFSGENLVHIESGDDIKSYKEARRQRRDEETVSASV